jgi:NAD(P)-dependent dehydrogenase (short-subunit alcohol dehydrogenase family)
MPSLESSDPRDVSDRVVIVTGGAQGIGRRYAQSFAAAGAIAVIADINFAAAQRVEAEITAGQRRSLAVAVDVADPHSTLRMSETVLEKFGRIDVLINNAAVFSTLAMQPFDQIPLEEWDRVLRVNTTGPYLCVRAVAPAMRKARWGRIINIATTSVAVGTPNYLHYVTSKSALFGMTNSLARELGKDGITVNCIIPGPTLTEVPRQSFGADSQARVVTAQCVPRGETPDDIVGLALFLASPAASFLTGQSIAVNGGLTLG